MRSVYLAAVLAAAVLSQVSATPTWADPIPSGAVGQNIEAVGYSNLNDKPGFKMSIQKVDEHWYLYIGMLWNEGWQIVDVTDPANPKVVKEIQGPDNTATDQMEIADGKMITALAKISPGWGGDPAKPFDEGVLIWDLKDPLNPQKLGQYKTGSLGTHRNGYQGGKYMHLSAIMPGYKGNIYVIVDISDPAHPVEAGRWWVPGQKDGEQPAAPPGTMLHGPAFVVGNTSYLPYGGAGMIILDISDVAHPKKIGQLSMSPPFASSIGVHTVIPVPDKGLAFINSEAIQEDCKEPLQQASIVDIADPARPRLMALFPLPLPPPDWPIKSFCERGGRFGPHNQNTLLHNPFVQPQGNLVYLTYFNAGLRIYDVSTPTAPREVGYFLPPDPTHRYGTFPKGKLVAQSTVDDLNGLKFRVGGWAGKTLSKLGTIPQQIAGGDIYPALEKGVIDAAEWVGPYDDEKLGFYKIAKYYYYPGWWEGGTALHFFINSEKWDALPKAYKSLLTIACGYANLDVQARYDARNPQAIKRLVANGAILRPFSQAIMEACLKASNEVNAETSAANPDFKKIYDSQMAFRDDGNLWWQVAEYSYETFMIRTRPKG